MSSEYQRRQLVLVVVVVVMVDVLVHMVGLVPRGALLSRRGAGCLQQGPALQPGNHLCHGSVMVRTAVPVLAGVGGGRPLDPQAPWGLVLGGGWGLAHSQGLLRGGLEALWGALLGAPRATATAAPW